MTAKRVEMRVSPTGRRYFSQVEEEVNDGVYGKNSIAAIMPILHGHWKIDTYFHPGVKFMEGTMMYIGGVEEELEYVVAPSFSVLHEDDFMNIVYAVCKVDVAKVDKSTHMTLKEFLCDSSNWYPLISWEYGEVHKGFCVKDSVMDELRAIFGVL